jgi:hypothetical protein
MTNTKVVDGIFVTQIPGFTRYWIADDGRYIWADETTDSWHRRVSAKWVPIGLCKGRRVVHLNNGRSIHKIYVSRLVALTFLGPPPAGMRLVLHKNDDLTNDHYTNLKYGNHSINAIDAMRNGKLRQASGERQGKAIYTDEQIAKAYLDWRKTRDKISDVAVRNGINANTMWRICRKRIWFHVTNQVDRDLTQEQ